MLQMFVDPADLRDVLTLEQRISRNRARQKLVAVEEWHLAWVLWARCVDLNRLGFFLWRADDAPGGYQLYVTEGWYARSEEAYPECDFAFDPAVLVRLKARLIHELKLTSTTRGWRGRSPILTRRSVWMFRQLMARTPLKLNLELEASRA